MWSPLINDGARYTCAIITFFEGEEWNCPEDATMALDPVRLERLAGVLRQFTGNRVQIKHRSFCPRHQLMVEGYLAA